jgi:hypothetical protein
MLHSKGFGELFVTGSMSKRASRSRITKERRNVPHSDRIGKLHIRFDILSLAFRVRKFGEVERRKKRDHRDPNERLGEMTSRADPR